MSKKKKDAPVPRREKTNASLGDPATGGGSNGQGGDDGVHSIALDGLYENWFLEYASYVILERAVPRIEDGFKPVQRRIMHSLKEMDDGRFNKVANVIGNAMQYHPHGDAAIGEAIVNIGQKDLLIETQGNWGDVRTGDDAAAARRGLYGATVHLVAHAAAQPERTNRRVELIDAESAPEIAQRRVLPVLRDTTTPCGVTLATVGKAVSTTRALLAPSELAAPGLGSASVAALPAVSTMVAPFRAVP